MSATSERVYSTSDDHTGLPVTVVRDLACRLKRFTSTDEGKIALAIELDANDEASINDLKALLEVQQGQILLSVAGIQGQLDL